MSRRRRWRHRPDCRHCPRVRALGRDYQAWRHAAELAREAVTYGYETENREYGRLPTFKDYLIQMAA